jgi:hypothetical protein
MRRKLAVILVAAAALMVPAQSASADTLVDDLSKVSGLSAEQKAAIDAYAKDGALTRSTAAKNTAQMAAGSRRATYYRGSFLMWTRDNVDFGYNWSSVTWSSPFQQAGSVFPNVARNRGITKYYNTTRNDRFRAANTIGAGIVTPWGDVTVYTQDYIHRLSVNHNGAWSAWSD